MTIPDVPTQTLPDEGEIGFVHIGSLTTEAGAVIDDVHIAVQRWGELSPTRDNVVVVLHALTGDSHVTGPARRTSTGGWWDEMVGPGAPIDTDRWCAVATNVLGVAAVPPARARGPATESLGAQGFPGSRFATRWRPTSRRWPRWASTRWPPWWWIHGRRKGFEWIVGHPSRVRAGLLLAVGARATADQIGTQCTQIAAIKSDPNWQGGDYHDTGRTPDAGLAIARRFAHLTYRGEVELDTRFGNDAQLDEDPANGGRYAVQSYPSTRASSWWSGSTRAATWC